MSAETTQARVQSTSSMGLSEPTAALQGGRCMMVASEQRQATVQSFVPLLSQEQVGSRRPLGAQEFAAMPECRLYVRQGLEKSGHGGVSQNN